MPTSRTGDLDDPAIVRITATGGPTPQQLAGARQELLRRPERTIVDARSRLTGTQLAVLRVRELYPSLQEVPELVLLAAAQPRTAGTCGWCAVRLTAQVYRQPQPPVTPTAVALLGPPCATCRPPTPKPKQAKARAKGQGASRSLVASTSRTSTRTRTSTSSTRTSTKARKRKRQQPAGPVVADTLANRQAAHRLGLTASACGWAQ